MHAFKRISACNKTIYFIICRDCLKEFRHEKSVVAIMTKILGNGTKGQNDSELWTAVAM